MSTPVQEWVLDHGTPAERDAWIQWMMRVSLLASRPEIEKKDVWVMAFALLSDAERTALLALAERLPPDVDLPRSLTPRSADATVAHD
jgi:hypothetical protein